VSKVFSLPGTSWKLVLQSREKGEKGLVLKPSPPRISFCSPRTDGERERGRRRVLAISFIR